jgi:putative membrane protein insertion efficiency factor
MIGRLLVAILAGYQRWVSPLLGPHCRFSPSCSSYAIEAIRVHGPARGGWLTARRLAKCQPFFTGGYDPVPLRAQVAHGLQGAHR